MLIDFQLTISQNLGWTNPVPAEVNNARLAQVQDCKGTPFEIFLSDLSTNEKPAFWALDQSEAWVSARLYVLVESGVYQSDANVPIDLQSSGTGLPMECPLTAN